VVLCLPVTQDTLVERTGKKAVADDAKARIIDNPTKSILAVGTVPDRVFGDSEGAGRGRGGELVLLDFCSTIHTASQPAKCEMRDMRNELLIFSFGGNFPHASKKNPKKYYYAIR